jgi:hypothetical protein
MKTLRPALPLDLTGSTTLGDISLISLPLATWSTCGHNE